MEDNLGLLLSIIVPVFNVEEYIRPCIISIFRQGLSEDCFEVIIVNDGTKDHNMEGIQDIFELHKNITVLNQENQGLSVARNNGIAMAKGEHILMPDSDDLLIENSVKPLLDLNFVHGFRQRLTTMMIKRMSHLFINLYYQYAKRAYKIKH